MAASREKEACSQVAEWNAAYPPGTRVVVRDGDGDYVTTTTEAATLASAAGDPASAWVRDGLAVLLVDAIPGRPIALRRVRVFGTGTDAERACDAWNDAHPVGGRVVYRREHTRDVLTTTLSRAVVKGDAGASVCLDRVEGFVSLDRVRPVTTEDDVRRVLDAVEGAAPEARLGIVALALGSLHGNAHEGELEVVEATAREALRALAERIVDDVGEALGFDAATCPESLCDHAAARTLVHLGAPPPAASARDETHHGTAGVGDPDDDDLAELSRVLEERVLAVPAKVVGRFIALLVGACPHVPDDLAQEIRNAIAEGPSGQGDAS
jgi:hypothetical protein